MTSCALVRLFWGRNEFKVGCRDTQLTTDELPRVCVDNLSSWDDKSALSGTGWDDGSVEA